MATEGTPIGGQLLAIGAVFVVLGLLLMLGVWFLSQRYGPRE